MPMVSSVPVVVNSVTANNISVTLSSKTAEKSPSVAATSKGAQSSVATTNDGEERAVNVSDPPFLFLLWS